MPGQVQPSSNTKSNKQPQRDVDPVSLTYFVILFEWGGCNFRIGKEVAAGISMACHAHLLWVHCANNDTAIPDRSNCNPLHQEKAAITDRFNGVLTLDQ